MKRGRRKREGRASYVDGRNPLFVREEVVAWVASQKREAVRPCDRADFRQREANFLTF